MFIGAGLMNLGKAKINPKPDAKVNPPWEKICLAVVAIVGLLTVACYLLSFVAALLRPYSLNYEGPMLWACAQLAQGKDIYPSAGLTRMPWITILYPPLYALLGAATFKLFGISYLGLRLISIVSLLVLAVCLFRLLRLFQCRFIDAVVCLFFFLNFTVVATYASEARPDMLALALAVYASERFVAWFLCREKLNEKGSTRLLSICAFIFALACLAKQQEIVFALAIIWFLLTQKMWRETKVFLSVWLGSVLLALVTIEVMAPGFFQHLTFLFGVPSQMKVLLANLSSFGPDWINILVALCAVPLGIVLSKKLKGAEQLPLCLWIVSMLLMLYTMGIPASNVNHALCALFALTWLLALTMRRLPAWTCAVIAVLCLVNLPAMAIEGYAMMKILPYANASAEKLKKMDFAGKLMLTDDPNLNYLTDSKPVFIDCASFMNKWQVGGREAGSSGGFSSDDFLDAIKQQKFACAMINDDDSAAGGGKQWWPKSVVSTLKQYYKKADSFYCSGWTMDLYLPRAKIAGRETR